jgi:hypothetical protein
MSFRYFVYLSATKVDMLLSQIDPSLMRKRSVGFSVDFKIFSASQQSEAAAPQGPASLERVVRYLQDFGDLGTVDEPGQFFWGMLPMRWGPFGDGAGSSLVYFSGQSERTIVGLGGSSLHVVGSMPASGESVAMRSALPALLDGFRLRPDLADLLEEDADPAGDQDGNRAALAAVHRIGSTARGPSQNVEFIAKRLLDGPSPFPTVRAMAYKSYDNACRTASFLRYSVASSSALRKENTMRQLVKAAVLTTGLAVVAISAVTTPAQASVTWTTIGEYHTKALCIDMGQQYEREGWNSYSCRLNQSGTWTLFVQ